MLMAIFGIKLIVNRFDTSVINDASTKNDKYVICDLKTLNLKNPIGIDEEIPFFSWRMEGGGRGLAQSAYQIKVAVSEAELINGDCVWDSGKVESPLSVGIMYEGQPLGPKSRYYWQVSVWGLDGEPVTSNEEAFFETGLMGEGMQGAMWISAPESGSGIYDMQEAYGADKDAAVSEEGGFEYTYDIKYDISVTNTAASFVFGAQGGMYKDMYLCEIKNSDEDGAAFRLRRMRGGKFVSIEWEDAAKDALSAEIDARGLSADELLDPAVYIKVPDDGSSVFAVELQVDHEILSVTVNGVKIGIYIIEATPVCAVGVYKERSTTYAYLDNVIITKGGGKEADFDNEVYVNEDFESEDNIFSPFYSKEENGRLRIGSGLTLTYYDMAQGKGQKAVGEAAPYFYKEFALEDKEIESARVYMTALGSFALICNGERVSDEYFAPGKFVYNQKLTYVSYDVSDLLEEGKNNALGIILLHGWYDRGVGYPEIYNPWGDTTAVMGMLEVKYKDGSVKTIVTDGDFCCSRGGPVRFDDIYHGEVYCAPMEFEGFGEAGFCHDGWQQAAVDAVDESYYGLPLEGKENEPVRCINELTPISVSEPVENVFVYDFGQNFAGTCRLKLKGDAGQFITLRYGEIINTADMDNRDDEIGTVWTQNLLSARATDYYVMKGAADGEIFEPEFTYHGFRYLQITGLDEAPAVGDVKGIVLSSDLYRSGNFECSDELLNKYYQNTVNSLRSNFMDNPTDCPQRDERHGWAGDAQIFSKTASYHMNTYGFYSKYLDELRLLQSEDGAFTDIAPRNFGTTPDGKGGGAGNNCWGDAAAVITWNLYVQYGNRKVIEENYDSICKWMNYLEDSSNGYIRSQGGYGDHLSSENTPNELSDTAWCARCAELTAKMARALGRTEDVEYYSRLYEKYKAAWQDNFITQDGVTVCDTQTSYALGLAFGLFPEELEQSAAERLDMLAQYSGYHINTGYSGIGYLLPALSEHGFNASAYKLMRQTEYPSLLYPVKDGATTTYESLSAFTLSGDGLKHYSGSLNHCAYGTPASWLYTHVLGIKSDESDPAFHHIIIQPQTDASLTYAGGSYDSLYGRIEVEWKRSDNGYDFNITVPANTTAALTLPAPENGGHYLEGGADVEKAEGVRRLNDSGAEFELLSGSYSFTVKR